MVKRDMKNWIYKIQGLDKVIITKNVEFAEQKSKLGYIINFKLFL